MAVVLAGLVGLAVGAVYSPLLKLRHVRVTVDGNLPASTVRTLAGLDRYQLMIHENPAATAARLDAVPQLGDSHVTRTWPGTVSVRVWVRTPIAVVAGPVVAGHPQEWAEVDATGRVLALTTLPPRSLTVVQGVGALPAPGQWVTGSAGAGATPAVEAGRSPIAVAAPLNSPGVPSGAAVAFAVADLLPASIRPDVYAVTVGTGGQVSLSVLPANIASGSMTVLLGDGSELASKLTSLTALLTEANLSGVSSINLTVPDRPAALTAR